MPTTVNLVLCAVLNGDDVLLITRAKPPYRGYRGLPGGKMRFGEHPHETALREGREETGLDLLYEDTAVVATETIDGPDGREAHFVMFVCRLRAEGREVVSGPEGELGWFPLDGLLDEDASSGDAPVIPSDRAMLRAVADGRRTPLQRMTVRREGTAFRLHVFEDDGCPA